MKTLDAGQASLLASVGLSLVTLCKLTTYSDRAAGTVQATRYFSDGARRYDWANLGTVQQFEPWLLRMDPGRDTMNHLPSMDGGGIESALRRRRKIYLRNWLPETGTYLYQTLRAENLEYARIEIAQVFVDRGAGASFNDLSAMTGGEMTWLFRGVIASVGSGNELVTEQEIPLECVAELPQIPWVYADVPATNDPKDLGARLPVVLGRAKHVPAVGWTVGWATTLAALAIAGATTLELTDASGLASSATGGARVGSVLVSWTGKTGNTLTGVTGLSRGQSAGQLVVEIITQASFIASAIPASAIGDVFVADPFTGAFVRVTTGVVKTLADAATIPGRTVASVRLSGSEIQQMLDSLAQVGQQPAAQQSTSETRRATDDNGSVGGSGNKMRDGNLVSGDVNPTGSILTWPAIPGRDIREVTYEVYATLLTTHSVFIDWPTMGTNVQTITNNSGATVTGWWRWTTSVQNYMGETMGFDCGIAAGSTIHQVQRIEVYHGGPTRNTQMRTPNSQVGSAHGSWNLTVDGDTATGITTPAVQLGYHWEPVAGRVLTEVIYRAYLVLQAADNWNIRTTSGGADVFITDSPATEGWFEYATTVPAEMGNDIYMSVESGSQIREVERIEVWEAVSNDVEIKSARVGLGLELFVDVDGPIAAYDWAAGYGFDETTGWSTATGTRTDESTIKTEGSISQKFVGAPTAPTLLLSCNNDAANWAQGDVHIGNEGAITVAGGSLRVRTDVLDSGGCSRTFPSAVDFTSKILRVSIYFAAGYVAGATTGVELRLYGSSGSRSWYFGTDDMEFGQWMTLELNPASGYDGGSGTITSLNTFGVFVNLATQSIGSTLYIDEIYHAPIEVAVAQRNTTAGTLDLTADGNTYRLDVRADGVTDGDVLRVYFSNTAGSGTTKPAAYWYFDIAADELSNGAFVTVEKVAIQSGAPASPTDVETVGFELLGTQAGTVYIDNLQKRLSTPTTDYTVAGGVLLDKIPDQLRYILAELCGLGHSVIDASFDTLCGATYLDDNAHGGDISVFGHETKDVLAALTYEGRCNITADERAAGTIYRLAAALSTYAWPASVRTLTKWQRLVEEGRDAETIRTRFRHLYQWHPELGEGIDSFAAAVQTTVTSAETKFGRHDADAVGLRTIDAAATATEIAGYYEQERSRAAALWRLDGVPWQDGYDLERGDVVAFTPPWAAAKKGRVIETSARTDGLFDLRVVEVA